MRATEFTESIIKIGAPSERAKAWIEKVYALYPGTFQNNHVMMWGEGNAQQFAMFELVPSMSKKDAVEVKWFQAYPLRQGVGSRAMAELQRLAREDGIALTLYPWDKGQVSQAKLMKFYRGHGFKPTAKGSKSMAWVPDLDEMAGEIHGGVRKALMAKGYKYLGSGIDKQAYLEPSTGQVLIVFGYRKGVEDFSPDQRMFIDWINYCNKNKNNPHLPRFSGFESFQFQGKNYIQARMEPLQEVSEELGYLVGNIHEVTKHVGQGNFNDAIESLAGYAQDSSYEGAAAVWYDIKTAIKMLGGKQQAKNLLDTVYTVTKFGQKHGFNIDLHRGNFMTRPNGTIVVNDPFVIWINGS